MKRKSKRSRRAERKVQEMEGGDERKNKDKIETTLQEHFQPAKKSKGVY